MILVILGLLDPGKSTLLQAILSGLEKTDEGMFLHSRGYQDLSQLTEAQLTARREKIAFIL